MGDLKGKIKSAFDNSVKAVLNEGLSEERHIPSDRELGTFPSIYKMIKKEHLQSYIDNGFQRTLAGNGGTLYGEGVYSSLCIGGSIGASRLASSRYGWGSGYGTVMLKAKVLGGFKNYLMFNGDSYKEIRYQIKNYYGNENATIEQQVNSIVKDPQEASNILRNLRHYGGSYSPSSHIVPLLMKCGIRGYIYDWSGGPTVLPFDFSSIILTDYAEDVYKDEDRASIERRWKHTLDANARERYEMGADWAMQLNGRYDQFDRNNAVKVDINRELYCVVQRYGKGYNIVKIDTDNFINAQPKEISGIWFDEMPTLPNKKDGTFQFKFRGQYMYGAVYLPSWNKDGVLWCPETYDRSVLNRPDINNDECWAELSYENGCDWAAELRQMRMVSENLKKSLRKNINEAISDKDETEFFSKHRCIVYICTHKYYLDGVLVNGFNRQFANDNDKNNNGGSLTYGDGVYGSVTFENARDNLSRKTDYSKPDNSKYGKVILKCVLLGGWNNFLIFDERLAKAVYKDKWQITDQIETIVKNDSVKRELLNYVNQFSGYELYNPKNDSMRRTNHVIFRMFSGQAGFKKWTDLFRRGGIRGCVYHGHGDGYCFVCYNYSDVIPFAYSEDFGNSFTKSFNFDEIKERSFRNVDPVQKFGHLYAKVSKTPVTCNINGENINVCVVETFNGRWNLININTKNGDKISPVDFDSEPIVGNKGFFDFKYRGVIIHAIIKHPEYGVPALWCPETNDPRILNRPNIEEEWWAELSAENINDWANELRNL